MDALIPLLFLSYPIWGSILFFLFCRKLSSISGTRANHALALRAFVVAMLAILIFTPVWFYVDTYGFRVLAPWLLVSFGSITEANSEFWWPNVTFSWEAVLWELFLAFSNFILQRKKAV